MGLNVSRESSNTHSLTALPTCSLKKELSISFKNTKRTAIKNTCSKTFLLKLGEPLLLVFLFSEDKHFIEIYVSLILTDGAAEVFKFH